ncbi:MAG TPA: beta-ketoacyl-ACP synthase III [Verrucomicrobiae bacterium]|nr:beta-ketoacyl-ACP synthase III [Verrucomicrobiae bacterium]
MSPKFKNPRARFNFQGRTCSISGVGSYVPAKILTNADLEKMVDTSDEWITTRTGIKERRVAAKNEYTSDMAVKAAQRAMKMAGVTAEQIDLIAVATITPDMPFPSTACLVQQKIGARRAAAFDLEAACSGFIYGLEIGQQFIMSRTYDTVLVIGAEKLSSIVNWKDRNTCVLFGDGAGAAVLQNRPNAHGLLTAVMGADGGKANLLFMPGGGSRCPASVESVSGRLHYLQMEGRETFKNAVQAMCTAAQEALRRCEVDISKIKCVIPHQANRRIIDAVGERLGATPEQLFINVNRYGNTSAASVAIALDEAVASGKVRRGDLILLVVFGAGLTWGAALIEW